METLEKHLPTEKEIRMLRAIRDRIEDQGWPPTVRELRDDLDISSTSVTIYRLRRMQEKGLINRGENITRAISITDVGEIYLDKE